MFQYSKFILIILIFTFGFILGNVFDYPKRFLISKIYSTDYQTLAYKCDNAMKEHFLAKSKLSKKPSEVQIRNLKSSEIALLDCHEYDKLRKKLLISGLKEEDLEYIFLESLEKNKSELVNFVKEHEIRY